MRKDLYIYTFARISAFAPVYYHGFIKTTGSIQRNFFIFINHSNLDFKKITYQHIDIKP